jgi:hypothetical protein
MKKLFLLLILLSLILFGFFAGFVMKVEPENKEIAIDVPLGDALKTQSAPRPATPVNQPVAQPVTAPVVESVAPNGAE